MVLAEGTAQVAAEASHGKDPLPVIKAVQRCLLDRIQGDGCDVPVVRGKDLSILCGTAAAEPGLPVPDLTVPETNLAPCHHQPPVKSIFIDSYVCLLERSGRIDFHSGIDCIFKNPSYVFK